MTGSRQDPEAAYTARVRRRHKASRGGVLQPLGRHASALVVLALVATLGWVALSRPGEVSARPPAMSMVDAAVSQPACALLGRTWDGQGCRRDRCVRAADAIRPAVNAEVCLRGGPEGARYGNPIAESRCRALHRRFVDAVNLCASVPERSRPLIDKAAACVAPYTTYAVHSERDADYDECLRPQQAHRWEREALRQGRQVGEYVASRSRTLCSFRPHAVFTGGECRRAGDPLPAGPRGTLLLGDSVAWRAADELADLRPGWTLDALPGRVVYALGRRIDRYLAQHRPPAVVVVALGTNPGAGWVLGDYLDAVERLPDSTRVVWVTPYRSSERSTGNPPWLSREVQRVTQAMRRAAQIRPGSCLVAWDTAARTRSELLLDGVHPTRAAEGTWARLVSRGATDCRFGG